MFRFALKHLNQWANPIQGSASRSRVYHGLEQSPCSRSSSYAFGRFYHAASNDNAAKPRPLEGVRVLDLTRVLAGPFCTMMLADLGADVIKIENPNGGDDTREWGPPYFNPSKMNPKIAQRLGIEQSSLSTDGSSASSTGESTYYLALNRNKRSIAVDLKAPQGIQVVKDLARHCQIVVENYQPGKLAKMGLDYESLKKIRRDVIYGSITGYGSTGPLSSLPGYDVMASSMGGLIGLTGTPEAPARPGAALTDAITGLNMQASILAALRYQDSQKRSHLIELARRALQQSQLESVNKYLELAQSNSSGIDMSLLDEFDSLGDISVHLETSLYESQIAALANLAMSYLGAGVEASRRGTAHGSIVPYQCFPVQPEPEAAANGAKTAFMAIGAMNDRQFVSFSKAIGMPELSADPKFKTNPLRVKHRDELLPILEKVLGMHPASYWQPKFVAANVPSAPVNTLQQVFENPHTWARDMVQSIEYPQPKVTGSTSASGGTSSNVVYKLPILGSAVKSSTFDSKARLPPPFLGQHTREVLHEVLNLSSSEIDTLIASGVVVQHAGFEG